MAIDVNKNVMNLCGAVAAVGAAQQCRAEGGDGRHALQRRVQVACVTEIAWSVVGMGTGVREMDDIVQLMSGQSVLLDVHIYSYTLTFIHSGHHTLQNIQAYTHAYLRKTMCT